MLLALVVLAVPPENSCEGGLLTRLRDIDKATGAQQLHHVTDGIASGKLSKAGHVDKLGECIDVLRAGSSAAESAKLHEPATCQPSRRWFQNPLLSLGVGFGRDQSPPIRGRLHRIPTRHHAPHHGSLTHHQKAPPPDAL